MKDFLKTPRPYEETPVVSGHVGNNAGLIADAARDLYIPDNAWCST